MEPAPRYVLELLKLLTEFSFNLLLKIKISFFSFISAPVAAVSSWTGKCTREFIAWAGMPVQNGSVLVFLLIQYRI